MRDVTPRGSLNVYRDAKRELRWRLVALNGNVVADSGEGYQNKRDLLRTASRWLRLESVRIVFGPGVPGS